ncbi:hypothetical protein DFR33_103362 [Bradymonas sediminis]|uniref:Uncharacterized protein n=2 Tax=Bradymonas sediminis TaxID=1548548 RepID=A0A2Z4FMG8_9DELT|nr:hypothetical protein DN745_12040 [Bradymonas sediminis]TDP76012.1 hypothetical protein DFR33_103362 [Bradymonas sediminis]
MYQSKTLRLFVAIAACAALAGACGDDDAPNGTITPGNNSAPDASDDASADADAGDDGDATSDPDAADPDTTSPDVEEPDTTPEDPKAELCDAPYLGTLAPNQSTSTVGDLASAENNFALSCAPGISRELVYRFAVEQPSRVRVRALSETIGNWNLQINTGTCEASARLACFGSGNQTFFAEPGIEYHLLLEPTNRASTGEVQVSIDTEAFACFPAKSATCNGDEIERCDVDYTMSSSTCPAGCSDDACNGDLCENAIEMDPSGTMRLEGSLAGLTNAYNFAGRTECFDSGEPLPTRGKDIVVALNGLRAGQTVNVDTSQDIGDTNDNAIFIVNGCDSTPTCLAGGDTFDEKLNWQVPADGDYLLIIDLISNTSDTFTYQITVDE